MANEQAIFDWAVESPNVPSYRDTDGNLVCHIICDSDELDTLEAKPSNDKMKQLLRWREKHGELPAKLKGKSSLHTFFGLPNPDKFPLPKQEPTP